MKRIHLSYLFQDRERIDPQGLSDYTTLDFVSNGHHLYGEILWPDSSFTQARPCVIMFHGFPGSARNDDIAHALCRIGCVVIVPHHRGAWGSEGKYLVSHCIEDATNLAEYAHSPEFCEKYNVSPEHIYLLGHSMGGNTALHAGKHLPWLRGMVLITPFDPTRYLEPEHSARLQKLLAEGKILQSDGVEEIYRDIIQNQKELSFPETFPLVKDKNILILAGEYDDCAPTEDMVLPLWKLLQQHDTEAVQQLHIYRAAHGLLGRRTAAIRDIAEFLKETC